MFWNFLELIFNTLPELKHTKNSDLTILPHLNLTKKCIIAYVSEGTVCYLSSVKSYLVPHVMTLLIYWSFLCILTVFPSFCSFWWNVVQTCLQRMKTRRPHVTVQKGSTIRSLRSVWSLRWSSPLTPMQRILRQSMQP